jgi:uncharacterized membrane protein (UPF0127 family)
MRNKSKAGLQRGFQTNWNEIPLEEGVTSVYRKIPFTGGYKEIPLNQILNKNERSFANDIALNPALANAQNISEQALRYGLKLQVAQEIAHRMDANDGYPIGEPLISIQKKQQGGTITDNEKAFLEELKISIGNKPLNIKVLNTDVEKEQGLIGVTKLAKNEGVLLPNSNSDDMRKMSIDTQLVWLDDDYKVIGTQQAKKGKQYKNSSATHFIELHPSINVKVGQKIDLNKERAIEIKPSKIQGDGAFIKENINKGTVIGLAHRNNQPSTELGQYHNHSENPNSENVKIGDNRYLVSLRPMKKGEEITVNYRNQPELEQPEDFKKK